MSKGAPVGKIVNGKLVIGKESWMSPWDQGLLYGYGLFETMRVYGGRIFALMAHLQRLFLSCSQLGIIIELSLDQLASAAKEYAAETGLDNGTLRLTLTRGDPHRGIHPAIFFACRELTYSSRDYEQGFSAMLSHIRRNQASHLVYHKTLNYMENLLALEGARRAGVQEALFPRGRVARQ
ncbi:hypothetical protein SY88_21075 [Clostridiales bacterium PH28_bin88]|nr:hypothetical protein SY88_21075 [Clostridiales bacterium PH28_bin88]